MIVVNSQLARRCSTTGAQTVLAHEAGHILSEHVLYQTAL